MLELNDIGAARTLYEYALQQARVPRQFWNQVVQPSFRYFEVDREGCEEGMKKIKGRAFYEGTVAKQEAAWTNLLSLVEHWTPTSGSSSVLISSPNIEAAQLSLMTMVHYMLSRTFHLGSRPYRVEVVRSHELRTRMNDLPQVVVLPVLMRELTDSQAFMVKQLLEGPGHLLIATMQTPQEFFDTYQMMPTHQFVVEGVVPKAEG